MAELSSGVIRAYIDRGCPPPQDRSVFRVLATKSLGGCKHRLGITDGLDTYKHGLIVVDNPGELPAKGDIVDLGYKSPGAPFENKIEEAKNEIKIYVIHNFKIMRENGTKESGPSTPGSSTPRSSSRESPNPERSPMGPPTSSRPCPGPSTPSSTSSADHTPTPHRPVKRPSYELFNCKTPESSDTTPTPTSSMTNAGAGNQVPTAKRALFGPAAKERAGQAWKNAVADPITKASHRIKDLNPYQNKYTILARVSHKGELNERHSSRWSGFVFNVTFEDESGDIRATAFEELAQKFHPILEEGKFYYLSHAKVNLIKNKKFNTTSHEFELGFDRNTVVNECMNAPSLRRTPSANLTPMKEISNKAGGDIVNVLGYCTNIGNMFEGVSRSGKRYKKRDIFLIDAEDEEVKVTLWDDKAENFLGDKRNVLVKGGKINEWNGQKSVSTSFNSTCEIDPDIDEAQTLNATLSTQPLRGASPSSSARDSQTSLSSLGLIKLELTRKSIADSASNFTVEAYVNEIKRDNLTYKACKSEGCKKKITEKPSGGYECRSCGPVDGFQHRYIMKASISDETDHQWVTAFEDGATDIFGIGAHDLMQLRDGNTMKFNDVIKRAQLQKFRFRLKYKLESYNDETRANATVEKTERLDQSCPKYWEYIQTQSDRLERALNSSLK